MIQNKSDWNAKSYLFQSKKIKNKKVDTKYKNWMIGIKDNFWSSLSFCQVKLFCGLLTSAPFVIATTS